MPGSSTNRRFDRKPPFHAEARLMVLATMVFVAILLQIVLPAGAQDQRGLAPENPIRPGYVNGRYYALVIGIDDYHPPMKKLKTAVNDAKAIGKLLNERYGFEVQYLLDQQATRFNILNAIGGYRNSLNDNDSLLIYYAGHGYSDHDADKAYWLPVDAESGISANRIIADDLTTDVKVLPSRHVLIISDSCYSGGLARGSGEPDSAQDQPAYIARMMRLRSRTLLASGGDEPVADSGSNGHSVFAYSLLQALSDVDKPTFSAIDLFYSSIRQQVAGRSDQVPEYSTIRNSSSEGGDFVFVRAIPPKPPVLIASAGNSIEEAYNQGLTYYKAHRFVEELPLMVRACEGGEPRGCRYAGGLSLGNVIGVPPNLEMAQKYLRKGCDAGVAQSCTRLASMYSDGRGVAEDDLKALGLHQEACDLGDGLGCMLLGWIYETGKGVAKDSARTQELYRKGYGLSRSACDRGDSAACLVVAEDYDSGTGVAKDGAQALAIYRQACDSGEAGACTHLGETYEAGKEVGKDESRALALYRQSCDYGDPLGCDDLGWIYRDGRGVAEDKPKAVELFRKSCEGNNADGCTDLAAMLFNGDGVAKDQAQAATFYRKGCDGDDGRGCIGFGLSLDGKDDAKAAEIFRKACDLGAAYGCERLAIAYESGKGLVKDEKEAARLYQKACDGEDLAACWSLGIAYSVGNGVVENDAQSAALYKKACDGGFAMSCSGLAYAYKTGDGVIKDPGQAVTYYRKSCDSGVEMVISGCDEVALAYANGDGVARDPVIAAQYARKSCDRNESEGCNVLGVAYTTGQGVEKTDPQQAIVLYRKACEGLSEMGCWNLGVTTMSGAEKAKDAADLCTHHNAVACGNLGLDYEYGNGVPKDKKQAEKLFHQACDGGFQGACEYLTHFKP